MKISEIFSLLYDPSSVALYGTVIFSLFSTVGLGNLDLLSSIFFGIFFLKLIPTILFIYYFRKGVVDVNLTNIEYRKPFFLIGTMSSLLAMSIFYIFNVKILLIYSIAFLVGCILIGLITRFWKASIHLYGLAATITAFIYVFDIRLISLYLVLIPTGYHRYKEKFHTMYHLIITVILAVSVTWLIYFIMW